MDPLDVLTNLEKVEPYFQAIFSADEQKVVGYELLGRIQLEDDVHSLGPFFQDESVPEEYKIEVDNDLLKKAIQRIQEVDEDILLFVNRDVNSLMADRGESFLQILFEEKENGFAIERVVMEITEHDYKGDMNQLQHLLTYIQTCGVKIAVANIGKDNSNLERIGQLSPNILKIDLRQLKRSSPSSTFFDVLYSISLLARKIGATLLYEDIEVNHQLHHAWKNGGRYFQGYYLHRPSSQFIDRDLQKEKLRSEFHRFITHEKQRLETLFEHSQQFHLKLTNLLNKYRKHSNDYNELIQLLAHDLNNESFRIYICDEDGFQQSGNVFKGENGWIIQPQYMMKNWSWRPYFLENILKMRVNKRGFFSDLYSDIETGETIRTFSYPINEKHFLFVDVPYAYLFEHDGLL